jgi:hypothetical protein
MKGTKSMKAKGFIECKVSRVQHEICHWENGADRVDREIDELRQQIAELIDLKTRYLANAIRMKAVLEKLEPRKKGEVSVWRKLKSNAAHWPNIVSFADKIF